MQNKETSLTSKIKELERCLREKNQIITHLENRISNQEKQIEALLIDSEEKNFQEIKKYYRKSIDRYIKNGKYLLLELDVSENENVYLPKNAKVVHFGQIAKDLYFSDSTHKIPNEANGNGAKKQEEMQNQLPTPLLREKVSSKIQTSVQGLNSDIEALKEKIKAYSTLIDNKTQSISKIAEKSAEKTEQKSMQQESMVKQFSIGKESTPKNGQSPTRLRIEQKSSPSYVKALQKKLEAYQNHISPIKRKANAKIIYIRK